MRKILVLSCVIMAVISAATVYAADIKADYDVYGTLRISLWKTADVEKHNMNKSITEKDTTLEVTDDTTRLGLIIRSGALTGNVEVRPDTSDHVRQWYVVWDMGAVELLGGKAMTPLNLEYCGMSYKGDTYDSYAAIYEQQQEMIQLMFPFGLKVALLKPETNAIRASTWEDVEAPYSTTETFEILGTPTEITTDYSDNTDFETFPKIEAGWHIGKWPVEVDIVGGFQYCRLTEKETYLNNVGLSVNVETEHEIISYLLGVGFAYEFSRYYIKMSFAQGQNPGSMGYPAHVLSSAILDDAGSITSGGTNNEIRDVDFSAFFTSLGFKVSSRFTFEAGGGFAEGEAGAGPIKYDDLVYHVYAQCMVALGKGVSLTPEWGQLSRDYKVRVKGDSTEYVGGRGLTYFEDDHETYFGIRLQFDF